MRLSRRTAHATAIVVMVLTLLSAHVSTAAAASIPTAGDAFSALVVMRTTDGMFAAPIHAAVMPDGRVFLLGQGAATFPTTPGDEGHMHFVMTPDPVGATLPATAVETDLMAPLDADHVVLNGHLYDDSLVCGGNTFLSDGRLMITAGTRTVKDPATGKLQLAYGGTYATAYDGTTWTRLPGNFSGVGAKTTGRWYPTLTRLADGRVLVTGGYDVLVPTFTANLSGGAAASLVLVMLALVPGYGLDSAAAEKGATAILATGLALVLVRRPTLFAVLAFLMAENGIAVAAVSVSGALPLIVDLGIAFDLVLLIAVAAVFHSRILDAFGTTDSSALRGPRG